MSGSCSLYSQVLPVFPCLSRTLCPTALPPAFRGLQQYTWGRPGILKGIAPKDPDSLPAFHYFCALNLGLWKAVLKGGSRLTLTGVPWDCNLSLQPTHSHLNIWLAFHCPCLWCNHAVKSYSVFHKLFCKNWKKLPFSVLLGSSPFGFKFIKVYLCPQLSV